MSDLFATIRRKAHDFEADTVRFLAEMISTPSFSAREEKVIAVIETAMKAARFDEVRVDGLGNVIGRIGSGPRLLAFDAHVDTVYPGDAAQWESDPFSPRTAGGRIFGRGAADQKGGMASMVCAARIIEELGLNEEWTLLFTGTVMEEDCDGLCWQYLIHEEKVRPELVVITEPTNLNLYRGQRGRMEINVALRGLSCHGSAPERGDNAVYKTARLALEIEALNGRLGGDPFLGKGSAAVTEVTSSSPSLCAVPDLSSLHIDRRLALHDTKESVLAEVDDAALRAGVGAVEVTVPVYDQPAYTGLRYPMEQYYPTWVLDEESPWLSKARGVYARLFEKEALVDKWTFSTNGVTIAGLNSIPCIGLGPGEEPQAHAPNESCPIDHLSEAAAFYAAFVAHLNGKG